MNEQNQNMNQVEGRRMTPPSMPQGQVVPPQMGPARKRIKTQNIIRNMQNVIRNAQNGVMTIPKWLVQYPIVIYMVALFLINLIYSAYSLPWYYILSGLVAVMVFFLYGSNVVKETSTIKVNKEKKFEKKLFAIAIIPRVALMLLLYWLFRANYGDAFGFDSADAEYYHDMGTVFSNALNNGEFVTKWKWYNETIDLSDLGYASYVGFVYWITDNSILFLRLIKCVLSSLTVILLYRLAKRNFDIQVARVSSIFVALWPNFWYYCTCHLKEVEMVFLAVLFVEQADQMLRSRQFTVWKLIPILLIAAAMFTFRTPLGLVALLSLVFSVVMSSAKVVSWGKRIIVGFLAVVLIGVVAGNRIEEQSRSLLEQVQEGRQKENMEWRGEREHGNTFAKYAGASVFAPMIFTLPFPTMVRPYDGQDVQQLNNGGNFVKNIISCFTILSMVMLLLSGKWREHLLPLSFLLGYLLVLTMSNFAQSERFHQPVMPFEFMFAAYGLSIAVTKPKYRRWFVYWCILMFVAAIAWNWFKLRGRGMI